MNEKSGSAEGNLPVDDIFVGVVDHGEGWIIAKQRIDRSILRRRIDVGHGVQVQIDQTVEREKFHGILVPRGQLRDEILFDNPRTEAQRGDDDGNRDHAEHQNRCEL